MAAIKVEIEMQKNKIFAIAKAQPRHLRWKHSLGLLNEIPANEDPS